MRAMRGFGPWKPKERCESSRTLLLRPSMRPLESPRRIAARAQGAGELDERLDLAA